MSEPAISVIIPTHGRAELLRASLESLVRQSLPRERYEVIVVDDGPPDGTADICRRLQSRLQLQYFHVEHSGISAAKNIGIFAAAAPILLFFDDDDCASITLLEEHIAANRRYAGENVAILGFTAWAPRLQITEVMHYVMEVGRLLFCYNMRDGQRLDFSYFWGGRSSCKRSFLVRHGVFRQDFLAIEDVELGYRLAGRGLEVVFCRNPVQYMNRPVTHGGFCDRCRWLGKSLVQFARLYPADPRVSDYCRVGGAEERWREMAGEFDGRLRRVYELEAAVDGAGRKNETLREELHEQYRWTFHAAKLKGMVDALECT